MKGTIVGPGPIILGGGALVLLAFLGLGFVLPTDWSADAELQMEAESGALMAYLDSPEGWRRWTPWPDSGVVRSGPERGAGSSLAWDDPELGSGSFTIDAVESAAVRYSVVVEGVGTMHSEGTVTLQPTPSGTLVRWREAGDLGRNPLMGYWALFMERAQATEMSKGLERLKSDSAPSR